jgi:hypothetical protein
MVSDCFKKFLKKQDYSERKWYFPPARVPAGVNPVRPGAAGRCQAGRVGGPGGVGVTELGQRLSWM